MVYDSSREVVVLFGGLNGGNSRDSIEFGDTWEYRCPQEIPPQEVTGE